MTAYQREFQKEEARAMALEKRNEKRKHIENIMREREKQKNDQQQKKWSRREEQNFLKTILAYGIEFSTKKDSSKIVWDRYVEPLEFMFMWIYVVSKTENHNQ